ncbi:MAG TPA: superoxide dismutase family protein [Acidimicrobiales bacterium]|nr:superoxide dismutase family protein [Acidimicrobiales bacterium]
MPHPMRWAALAAAGALAAVTATVTLSDRAEAGRPLARAVLHDAAGTRLGTVTFTGTGHHADRVDVDLDLPADAPNPDSYHGLHVHAVGECTPPFTTAGGHWNLDPHATHGHHTGDLASVLVQPDGRVSARSETHRFDVDQLFDADGSAVILHVDADNFGNVPIAPDRYADPNGWYDAPGGTAATGDAGGRYGCGVVERR